MDRQPTLFDTSDAGRGAYGQPIPPSDPHIHPDDAVRVAGLSRRLLDLFLAEPVQFTPDLAARISHRFGARLHDLEAAGCVFKVDRLPGRSGNCRYELKFCPEHLRGAETC